MVSDIGFSQAPRIVGSATTRMRHGRIRCRSLKEQVRSIMGNSTDVEMMGRLYDLLAQKEMALKDKEMALLQKDLALLEKEKEISVLQKEREMALLEREHANDEVLKLQEEKLESQTWPFVS